MNESSISDYRLLEFYACGSVGTSLWRNLLSPSPGHFLPTPVTTVNDNLGKSNYYNIKGSVQACFPLFYLLCESNLLYNG